MMLCSIILGIAVIEYALSITSSRPLRMAQRRGVSPFYKNDAQKVYKMTKQIKFYEQPTMILRSKILGNSVIEYALSINLSIDNSTQQLMKQKEEHDHKSQSNKEVFKTEFMNNDYAVNIILLYITSQQMLYYEYI